MQIEISTDSNIKGREELATHVKGVVESALNRFSETAKRTREKSEWPMNKTLPKS
jgi:hypothetical protein